MFLRLRIPSLFLGIALNTAPLSATAHTNLNQPQNIIPANALRSYNHPSKRESIVIGNRRLENSTGLTLALYNLRLPAQSDDPETAARQFLVSLSEENFPEALKAENFQLIAHKKSPIGDHIHFQQLAGDIPIYRSTYVVSIDNDKTIRMAVGNPIPDFQLPGKKPAYSQSEAIRKTRDHLNGEALGRFPPSAELVGYRDQSQEDHLAWVVHFNTLDPRGDWVVIWDALDGSLLERFDQACYKDGTGMVFLPDPLTTAEAEYVGNYRDLDDADTPELNAERILVPLRDLTFQDGIYYLAGPWVRLEDLEPPVGEIAWSPTPDGFDFSRSQQGFEDVMVYFHIDNSQRYLQSLGFLEIQNAPILADPHGMNGEDNSHYVPNGNYLAFGEGGIDDAEDADVIYHEYGHAIQYAEVPGWWDGDCPSMAEGFCDYWAGTFSQGWSDFGSNLVFNWDGWRDDFWLGRRLDYPGIYPDDWIEGEIYHNGQIWSNCLWIIRSQIGAKYADKIIVQSHYFLTNGASVEDAAFALLLADDLLFSGQHHLIIGQACLEKGFLREIPYFGSVEGVITDAAGGFPVENAEILIDNVFIAKSDDTGWFHIDGIPVGRHVICIQTRGYTPWREVITIEENRVTYLEVILGQPELSFYPEELNVEGEIGKILDTTLTLTNTGNSDAHWSMLCRADEQVYIEPWTLDHVILDLCPNQDCSLQGVTAAEEYLVISSANGNNNPNKLYILNSEGDYLYQLNQPTLSAYGFRDLTAIDGIIYGSENRWIVGMTLEGEVVDSIYGPYSPNRALTYDAARDWFWCADQVSDIVAIDRQGIVQARFSPDLNIYGLGYFPDDPEGMTLQLYSQDQQMAPHYALVSKLNPETGDIAPVESTTRQNVSDSPQYLRSGEVVSSLGGLHDYWSCILLYTTAGHIAPHLEIYKLATLVPYLTVEPHYGVLPANQQSRLQVCFNAEELTHGRYEAYLDIFYEGRDSPRQVSTSFRVISVTVGEHPAPVTQYVIACASPNPFNSSTSWFFQFPNRCEVEMKVFDLLGRELETILAGSLPAGWHQVEWTPDDKLSSGLYFVTLRLEDWTQRIEKVVYLK